MKTSLPTLGEMNPKLLNRNNFASLKDWHRSAIRARCGLLLSDDWKYCPFDMLYVTVIPSHIRLMELFTFVQDNFYDEVIFIDSAVITSTDEQSVTLILAFPEMFKEEANG